jgi:cytochrome P450
MFISFNEFDLVILNQFKLHSVVGRRCTKATTVKGIDIPLDLAISVDVLSLHMDPEIWGPEDPHEFYPPRLN